MATDWATIRANYNARLLAISEELGNMNPDAAGGLPDYKGSGGTEHVAYRLSLMKEADWINAQLAKIPGDDGSGGTVVRIVRI